MNIFACLLPFLVGCGWFAFLAARPNKTLALYLLALMALLSGIYFLTDAVTFIAAKDYDSDTLVYAALIQDFTAPLFPITTIAYFILFMKLEQHASARWLIIILPFICYAFVAFLATQALGVDKAEDYLANNHMIPGGLFPEEAYTYKIYEFVVFDIYRWLMLIGFGFMIITILIYFAVSDFKPSVIYRFFFKGGPIRPSHVVGVFFIILLLQSYFRFSNTGKWMMQDASTANIVYVVKAVTIFFIGLFGYHGMKPAIYLVNKHKTPRFDDLPILTPKENWREESNEDEYRLPVLQNDFLDLIREQQCYRRPGLNIYSVARELGVTANSLNHMVKSIYGVNYNTYVKVQRVAFARRYHNAFPELPAETVAMESGFRSAKIMRQHFKEASYVKV